MTTDPLPLVEMQQEETWQGVCLRMARRIDAGKTLHSLPEHDRGGRCRPAVKGWIVWVRWTLPEHTEFWDQIFKWREGRDFAILLPLGCPVRARAFTD